MIVKKADKGDKICNLFDFHTLCREQRKYTLDWSFVPPLTITTFYNPDTQELNFLIVYDTFIQTH